MFTKRTVIKNFFCSISSLADIKTKYLHYHKVSNYIYTYDYNILKMNEYIDCSHLNELLTKIYQCHIDLYIKDETFSFIMKTQNASS